MMCAASSTIRTPRSPMQPTPTNGCIGPDGQRVRATSLGCKRAATGRASGPSARPTASRQSNGKTTIETRYLLSQAFPPERSNAIMRSHWASRMGSTGSST